MTQAFNLAQLANNLNSSGQLDATDGLYGVLPVANGGTGQSSLTANNVLLGNGTSGFQVVAPGTNGNVLTSNGTTWVSASIPPAGLGAGQSWENVTGSRSLFTNYTNSTGKPIAIFIQGSTISGYGGGYCGATIQGFGFSGTWGYSGAVPASFFAVVPNGATYSYAATYVTSVSIYELR